MDEDEPNLVQGAQLSQLVLRYATAPFKSCNLRATYISVM